MSDVLFDGPFESDELSEIFHAALIECQKQTLGCSRSVLLERVALSSKIAAVLEQLERDQDLAPLVLRIMRRADTISEKAPVELSGTGSSEEGAGEDE